MPIISEFFGIKIYMYWEDHFPEHFHAEYGQFKVIVSIKEAVVIKGALPTKQVKLVLAWCEMHKEELLKNWKLAEKNDKLIKITGLK